jgi:hypothetical protein
VQTYKTHFSDLTKEKQNEILEKNDKFFKKFFNSEILEKLNESARELTLRYGFEPFVIETNYLGELEIRGALLVGNIYDTIERLIVEERNNKVNLKKIMKMYDILNEVELVLLDKRNYKMQRRSLRFYSDSLFSNLLREKRKEAVTIIKKLTKIPKIKKDAKALEMEIIYEGDVEWEKVKKLLREFTREKIDEMKEFEDYLITKNAEIIYFLKKEKERLSSSENIRSILINYDKIQFDEKNQLVWI